VAGDAAQASAVDMVIIASGAFSAVSSIELVDMEEMQQAMKAASKIARKYKAPHQ
jgi:diadenosine tetraphosphate (Ap4A) HIT family hydrolase